MLIDFESVHATYLKGSMAAGTWAFSPVNAANPKVGMNLSTFQVFSNAGLGVAVYLRNSVDDANVAIKVHVGLKLVFSRKQEQSYLLFNDDQRITMTLDVGGVRALYAWLAGDNSRFEYEIARPGAPKKLMTGFETDQTFPLTLRASESDLNGGSRMISVGLSDSDIFHIQLHCLALAKLLYPCISDAALIAHMKPRVRAQENSIPSERTDAGIHVEPSPALTTQATVAERKSQAVAKPGLTIDQCKRAVYGVGKSKWPRKDIETIEYIQGGSVEAMDRFVKAGNAGDFTEWERIYNFLHPDAC